MDPRHARSSSKFEMASSARRKCMHDDRGGQVQGDAERDPFAVSMVVGRDQHVGRDFRIHLSHPYAPHAPDAPRDQSLAISGQLLRPVENSRRTRPFAAPRSGSVRQISFQASDGNLYLSQGCFSALDLLLRSRIQQRKPCFAVSLIYRWKHRVHEADLAPADVTTRVPTSFVASADADLRQRDASGASRLGPRRGGWRRFLAWLSVVVGNPCRQCFALALANRNRPLVVHCHWLFLRSVPAAEQGQW